MPAKFQAPRGTRDLLPDEMRTFRALEDQGRRLTALYGYQPIETPLFEDSNVFERGIGKVTDIVEKELFRVRSPGSDDDRWALRPEPTAGICRAYVEHGMHTLPQPVKLTMFGPMFRYDRPQAGRYRQFWQFDVEAIGDAGPAIDAEIIELAYRFITEAGVAGLELHLNSIGDANCRPAYIAALVEFMERYAADLPELDRHRLQANPLRLLDTKTPRTLELLAGAPQMAELPVPGLPRALGGSARASRCPGHPDHARRPCSCAASTTTRAPHSSSTSTTRRASSRRSAGEGATTA